MISYFSNLNMIIQYVLSEFCRNWALFKQFKNECISNKYSDGLFFFYLCDIPD